MKPAQFNPSPLEVDFAKTIAALKDEILKKMPSMMLDDIETAYDKDNPHIIFKLTENDGTPHEIMVKFIERELGA